MSSADGAGAVGEATVGPLAGVVVAELGQYIAAPMAGKILADLGATVIKIEPPQGDPIRFRASAPRSSFTSGFAAVNRGKKSITLDLKTVPAQRALRELLAGTDVFLHNVRDAALGRLGIDLDTLLHEYPHLIVCAVSGFGPDGPLAATPAFDAIISGVTGLYAQLGFTGLPAGPPFSDLITGQCAAQAVLAALHARERDPRRRGQRVDVSMIASVLSCLDDAYTAWFDTGTEPTAYSRQAAQHVFYCTGSDGAPFVVQPGSADGRWRTFVSLLGDRRLTDDPRFETFASRLTHYDLVTRLVADAARSRPRAAWLAELAAADIPAGPVHRPAEAADDPQLAGCGAFVDIDVPGEAPLTMSRPVGVFSATPTGVPSAPPAAGMDTIAVLDTLALTDEDRSALVDTWRGRRTC